MQWLSVICVENVRWVLKRRWWKEVVVSVMCLVCVLFHGSLYPFYEMFFLSCFLPFLECSCMGGG